MSIGLSSTADIIINVKVEGESLTALKTAMASLGKAMNADTANRQFANMEQQMDELRAAVTETKAKLEQAQDAIGRSARDASEEVRAANAKVIASEEAMQNSAREMANTLKAEYKKGENAARQASQSASKGVATKKKNAEAEAALLKRLMTFQIQYGQAVEKAVAIQNDARQSAQSALNKETENIRRNADASQRAMNAKHEASLQLRASYNALMLASAKVLHQARQEEIAVEQVAQAERERAEKMKMYAAMFDQIDAKAKRRVEIGEMLARVAEKQAKADEKTYNAAKQVFDQERRNAAQAKIVSIMEKQKGDYLARNQKLYIALKNATNLSRQELTRYTQAVRESIAANNQHRASLKGQGPGGFLGNLRYSLSHYEQQMDAIFRASFRMQMVGNNLMMFARDIARWGGQIMNTFGEYEFMLNRAAGAMEIWRDKMIGGAQGTDLLSQAVQDAAQEVILFPAQEIAESLYYWGSATGQVVDTVEDLNVAMGGMIPIMKVAAMTNSGYEDTVKGVYSILTQFYQGQLEYAPKVTKTLFFITQKTAAEFKDLVNSFKMVGPVAAQMGVTFEETATIFGRLSDLGVRASMAGRGFRQMFIQLVRPSGPAKKRLDELWNSAGVQGLFGGKSFNETVFEGGAFIGVENYMKVLYKATESMEAWERQAFLAGISTANSLPMISALVSDYGRELVGLKAIQEDKIMSDEKVNEFFEKNWELLSKSWKGVAGNVQRAVERITLVAGAGIAEALTPFAEKLSALTDRFREFIELNPQLVGVIAKMAAGLGAFAAVAGIMFKVTGSLAGLGAAIYLVVNSFKPWFGAMGGAIASLTLLFDAVVRNAEYIQRTLGPALDGIAEAFRRWADSTGGVQSLIERMRASLAPIFDSIVRVVTDLVTAIADLVTWVIRLDTSLSGALSGGLGMALALFSSTKLIGGIMLMAKGLAVMVGAKIVGGLKALAAGFVVLTGAITGVTKASRILTLAGGPVAWVAFAASLMVIGEIRIPLISDAIDTLTHSMRDLNKEMDEAVAGFGVFSDEVEVFSRATSARQWDSMPYADKIRVSDHWPTSITDDDMIKRFENSVRGEDPKKWIETKKEQWVKEQSTGIPAALEEGWAEIAASLEREGRNAVDQSGFWQVFKGMRTATESDFMSKLDAVGFGLDIGDLLSEIPDFMSAEEAVKVFENIKSQGYDWADKFEWHEFFSIFGGRISKEFTSSAQDDYLPAIKTMGEMVNLETAAALRDAMMNTPLIDGKNITEILNNPALPPQVQALAKYVFEKYDSLLAEEAGAEGGFSLSQTAEAIQANIGQALENIFMTSFPDMREVAGMFENLALVADREMFAETVIDMLDTVLTNGGTLESMLRDANFDDTMKSAIMPALENALKFSDSPELKQLIEDIKGDVEEAGNETGEAIKGAWIEGLSTALSGRLDPKELKKLAKMGTTVQQIGRLFKGNAALRKIAFGKNQSRQSRQAYMEMVNLQIDAADAAINKSIDGDQRKRRLNKFLDAVLPNLSSMPKQERNTFIRSIISLGKISPSIVANAIINSFPKDSKLRQRILEAILPEEPDAASASKWATNYMSTITKYLGQTGQIEEVSYDPLSSIGAGKKEAVKNPFGDVITGLLDAVPELKSVITAATNVGTDVQTIILAGLSAVSKDSDALNLIGDFLGYVSEGIITADDAGSFFKNAGNNLGLANITGFIAKITADTTMNTAIATKAGGLSTNLAMFQASLAGQSIGTSWVDGMVAAINRGASRIGDAADNATMEIEPGGSPPKTGPLKNIDRWGEVIGQTWVDGVSKGVGKGVSAFSMSKHGMQVINRNKREVRVKLEVSSPDGTANRQKQGEIRRGALEALTVAGLEHYVTVG